MKKVFLFAILALASAFAIAGDLVTESGTNGYTVRSRTLNGNTLTNSVCDVVESAQGTNSICMNEVVKLSKRQLKAARAEFRGQYAMRQVRGDASASYAASLSQAKSFNESAVSALGVSESLSNSRGLKAIAQ